MGEINKFRVELMKTKFKIAIYERAPGDIRGGLLRTEYTTTPPSLEAGYQYNGIDRIWFKLE